MKKKYNIKKFLLKNLLTVLVIVLISLGIYQILSLDVLPYKYLIPILLGEGLLFLVSFFLYNTRKVFLIIIGILFYLFMIVGNALGYYYLQKVNSYISTSFTKETYTIKTKYFLVAATSNPISTIFDLPKEAKIDYYKYSRSIDKALKKLGQYEYKSIDTVIDSMKEIQNTNNYLLIGEANYNYLFENAKVNIIKKEDFKIIHEFEVSEEVKTNKETSDSYNIYINGLDFTGVMRDYNLIATINTKTHKVVLTSIPRDYYMDVPGYNIKDTLMCLGSLDTEISKEALEKLFNIKIDYTININTNSLVKVVDTLGGIEFCSDTAFWTTHAMVQNTYNDTLGRKLYVPQGCKSYNGIQILTIARERNAFPGRDRVRQKNCRQILITILKKLLSITTLTNYDEIIKSFDGLYTTDINEVTVKQLIKTSLENPNFEIIEQNVDGTDSIGIGHLGTTEAWIMTPDMNTVNKASETINKVLKEN